MRGDISTVCTLLVTSLALVALECVWGVELCERGRSWLERRHGACVPCTRCDAARRLAVKYPCQVHRDTVCYPLHEIRIWPFTKPRAAQNDGNDSELYSDYEYEDSNADVEVSEGSDVHWDLQLSTLTLAASGCIVFFVVVLVLSIYHAKQWRLIRQVLKSDVQNLSAKLKLMEAGVEPSPEPSEPTDHHVYCNIHVGKEALLRSTMKGLGNVYTQEKHPNDTNK